MAAKPRWRAQTFSKDGRHLHVMIETPKGRRNKVAYEPSLDCFVLRKILPAGATFPYDFGFVPGTCAEDGDPVDALVLMGESVAQGCLVPVRVLGVLEAEQREEGRKIRNDQLITVAAEASEYQGVRTLSDLSAQLLKEIEHFFVSYHQMDGDGFESLGMRGAKTALRLIQRASPRPRTRRRAGSSGSRRA
jgi:inorganic pyrophosphatase